MLIERSPAGTYLFRPWFPELYASISTPQSRGPSRGTRRGQSSAAPDNTKGRPEVSPQPLRAQSCKTTRRDTASPGSRLPAAERSQHPEQPLGGSARRHLISKGSCAFATHIGATTAARCSKFTTPDFR